MKVTFPSSPLEQSPKPYSTHEPFTLLSSVKLVLPWHLVSDWMLSISASKPNENYRGFCAKLLRWLKVWLTASIITVDCLIYNSILSVSFSFVVFFPKFFFNYFREYFTGNIVIKHEPTDFQSFTEFYVHSSRIDSKTPGLLYFRAAFCLDCQNFSNF